MKLDTRTKYIIGGIIAVVVIVIFIKYFSKNEIIPKPVSLKVKTNYANEVVKVEPSPQPLVTDGTAKDNANRIVYQTMQGTNIPTDIMMDGVTKNVMVNTLAYIGQITPNYNPSDPANAERKRYDTSLNTFTQDRSGNKFFHPLYDYNPSNYAVIYPCITGVCQNLDAAKCCDIQKQEFIDIYKASPQVYNRLYFPRFVRAIPKVEQSAVGTNVSKMSYRVVNTIISIYFNLINQGSIRSSGRYSLRYGKYYNQKDTVSGKVRQVTYDELKTPVNFNLADGQNEVLIEFDPVSLYNAERKVIDGFYIDIRREMDDGNNDPRVYVGEILFNFKTDFDATKQVLVDREYVKPADVKTTILEGAKGRIQGDIETEYNRCKAIDTGYMYNYTGNIDSSECVKPCTSDVDCQTAYREMSPNSNRYLKLVNSSCSGVGTNIGGANFKFCQGIYPTDSPAKTFTF